MLRDRQPTTAALALMVALLALAAVPTAAVEVALFANDSYVDYRLGQTGSEVNNLSNELDDLGYRLTIFTGIAASDFAAGTAGKAALVIPELENGDLGDALTSEAETAIRDYVRGGGVLVMFEDMGERGEAMLNQIFGYSLSQGTCNDDPGDAVYTGALHQGVDGLITTLDLTCEFSGLPGSAQGFDWMGVYGAASIAEDDGYVVLFGWDWYGSPMASHLLDENQAAQVWRGLLDHAIRLGVRPRVPGTPTNEPGATLLIPYFKVDLNNPAGFDTLFSVNNAAAGARLTSITLWTDWGVPSLTFHLYLTGYDLQTISLRSIFFNGSLPITGSGVTAAGPLSDPNVDFTACASDDVSGQLLDSLRRAQILALHSGQSSPTTGLCGGSPQPEGIVVGYVTVDVVTRCDVTLNPSTSGYFGPGGLAAMDNVLYGEVYYVDRVENSAQGTQAVPLRADEAAYAPGDYTFYGRYDPNAHNAREPLRGTYLSRYFSGGAFSGGTTLLIWRDNKSSATAEVACGSVPSWAPLQEEPTLVFDEEEDVVSFPTAQRFPYLVQAVDVPSLVLDSPFNFGMMVLDLNHDYGPLYGSRAQGWVVTVLKASGLYSIGYPAMMVEDVVGTP